MRKHLKGILLTGLVLSLSVSNSILSFADNGGMNVSYDSEWLRTVNTENVGNFSGTYESNTIIGDGAFSAPPVFVYNPKYVYSGYIKSDNEKAVGVYWIENNIINIEFRHTYFADYDDIARNIGYTEKNGNAQFVVDGDYLISLSHLTDISIPNGETFELLKTEELYYGGGMGTPGAVAGSDTDKIIEKLQWKGDGTFTITYDGDIEAYKQDFLSNMPLPMSSSNILEEFHGTYKKVGNEIQIYNAVGEPTYKYYDYKGCLVDRKGFLKKVSNTL